MICDLQLIYKERKYCYTESFMETDTIYESPFNSYIMFHPTENKELNEVIKSSVLDVLSDRNRRDDVNGYVIDILLVNDKISVDIINRQNICESLIKFPVEHVKDLGKMIFNKMRKIQVKNKWLGHQAYMNHFYNSAEDYISYENTTAKSSISLKYVSSSKNMTSIEKKIIEAFNMFMSLHLMDDCHKHCTAIELERVPRHPIITGIIHDNLGYYKRIMINLKNMKETNKVSHIINELEKNYQFIYEQAEVYYKKFENGGK